MRATLSSQVLVLVLLVVVGEEDGRLACSHGANGLVLTDYWSVGLAGMKAAFAAAGKKMPTLKYHCINRIPYARYLGP